MSNLRIDNWRKRKILPPVWTENERGGKMKEYFVKALSKQNGDLRHTTAFMYAQEKVTEADIKRWTNELKTLLQTENEIIIEGIFGLEEEKECEYKESCPSRSGWCERKNPNYEQCIGFILAAYTRQRDEVKRWQQETDFWKREAIEMVTAAGEEKIREYEKKKDRSRNDGGDGRGIRQQESV